MENLLFHSDLSKLLDLLKVLADINKVMFFDYETVERKCGKWIQLLGNCRSRGREDMSRGGRLREFHHKKACCVVVFMTQLGFE